MYYKIVPKCLITVPNVDGLGLVLNTHDISNHQIAYHLSPS
jgi:hypothetical protein